MPVSLLGVSEAGMNGTTRFLSFINSRYNRGRTKTIRLLAIMLEFFICIFILWGKEGKCIMHRDVRAPCVGLQHGLPLGSLARWTICRLTYPLKLFPAGWLGYIPLRKVDDRV